MACHHTRNTMYWCTDLLVLHLHHNMEHGLCHSVIFTSWSTISVRHSQMDTAASGFHHSRCDHSSTDGRRVFQQLPGKCSQCRTWIPLQSIKLQSSHRSCMPQHLYASFPLAISCMQPLAMWLCSDSMGLVAYSHKAIQQSKQLPIVTLCKEPANASIASL